MKDKIIHTKGRALTRGEAKEGRKEGEYGLTTFHTRMNIQKKRNEYKIFKPVEITIRRGVR
jgi:hypothetical protein